jgi:hypothetical protein
VKDNLRSCGTMVYVLGLFFKRYFIFRLLYYYSSAVVTKEPTNLRPAAAQKMRQNLAKHIMVILFPQSQIQLAGYLLYDFDASSHNK